MGSSEDGGQVVEGDGDDDDEDGAEWEEVDLPDKDEDLDPEVRRLTDAFPRSEFRDVANVVQ